MPLTIEYAERTSHRQCGDCQLCCKLLPMQRYNKPAGERCKHQRTGVGCKIYKIRPSECQIWNCRWLGDPEGTASLRRPDRSRYVLDITPDFITAVDPETGERTNAEVVQIWCDPAHRDAYRDPALRAYLLKEGERGCAALVRYSETDAFVLFPPNMTDTKDWCEVRTAMRERTHTAAEKVAVLGDMKVVVSQ